MFLLLVVVLLLLPLLMPLENHSSSLAVYFAFVLSSLHYSRFATYIQCELKLHADRQHTFICLFDMSVLVCLCVCMCACLSVFLTNRWMALRAMVATDLIY